MSAQLISKTDAATRQLHLAILLHFQNADVIGVHTLAGAAHGLLSDLRTRSKGSTPLSAPRDGEAHQSQHRYVVKMVREAVGFFKHADRGPERSLRFNAAWTDYLIYDAISMHIGLTRTITHPNTIFLLWVTAKYPTVLLFDEFLGEPIAKLRELFPRLGHAEAQKRVFLRALNTAA